MNGAGGHDPVREIARSLSQVIAQALADGAPVATLHSARDLAQLLSLRGLDRLLAAVAPHAGDRWPAAMVPVLEQVRRAALECGREGNVEPLRRVDDELSLMAQAIERVWPTTPAGAAPDAPSAPRPAPAPRPPAPSAEVSPVSLATAMEGLPVARGSEETLRSVLLPPPVAGALRAALDWLLGEATPRPRPAFASDGSALEVTCEGVHYSGLHPAAEVLASVGGHLGPAGDRPNAWTVRVPVAAARETFLMLEQGELQLAVPWHAVSRVKLMPIEAIDALSGRKGLPVLEPITRAPRRAAELPVVVVALGLKRACLVADRLVWRMSAEPASLPGASPAQGIVRAVRSSDDELYWVLEPAWLLRGVTAPPLAEPPRRRPPPAAPPRVETPARPIAPAPAGPAPAGPPPPIPFPSRERAEARPEPVLPLEAAQVEPLAAPPAASAPTGSALPAVSEPPVVPTPRPLASPPPAPVPTVAPPSRAPARREVLVAEDSITARIFLARMLEQRGFAVHAVGTAAELRALLPHGPWALVCADSELPDARGSEYLTEIMRAAADTGSPMVALVRDGADERLARVAGVVATLRKPYEPAALARLLSRLVPDLPGTTRAPGHPPDPGEWGAR